MYGRIESTAFELSEGKNAIQKTARILGKQTMWK